MNQARSWFAATASRKLTGLMGGRSLLVKVSGSALAISGPSMRAAISTLKGARKMSSLPPKA